jgi:TetR/AcrR family transcriptional regulator, transcriptional repressor for nem operon
MGQKEQTRALILGSASRLLRERGIGGANVADVMKGAGLTVGGFYAHFGSKKALVDETLRNALRETRAKLRSGLEGKSPLERIEAVLARYLSAAHRDEPSEGCPLPAVASEIATTERAYAKTLAAELPKWAEAPGLEGDGISARTVTFGLMALMVGGLTLSRALRGTPLSDEVLASSRRFGRAALKALTNEGGER